MCFSLGSVAHLFIIIILVFAGFLILRVLLGIAARFVGQEYAWAIDAVIAIIRIVIGAAIVIAICLFAFELLACVVPAAIR
jgi:hypothetical protein